MLAGQSLGARPGWLGRFFGVSTCTALALLLVAPSPRLQAQTETQQGSQEQPRSEKSNAGDAARPSESKAGPAQNGQSQTVPEEYRFAAGLYRQQRWDLAADAFRKFIKNHPDHERVPYARLYLGLTLVNADKYAEARDVLRAYVRDYPQSKSLPDALYRAGECSYLLDDLKSADRELGRFVKEYPRHELVEWALPYFGDSKLRLKEPAAARDSFKTALEQFPRSRLADDSKFGLARAYEELHQDRAAAEMYEQLAEDKNGPRAPQALMNLATIRFRGGKFEEASQTFLRLPADFPKSSLVGAAHLNAGFALYELALSAGDGRIRPRGRGQAAGRRRRVLEGAERKGAGRLSAGAQPAQGDVRRRSQGAARRRSPLLLGRMRAADGPLRQGEAALSGGRRKISQGGPGRRRTALCRRGGHARGRDR